MDAEVDAGHPHRMLAERGAGDRAERDLRAEPELTAHAWLGDEAVDVLGVERVAHRAIAGSELGRDNASAEGVLGSEHAVRTRVARAAQFERAGFELATGVEHSVQ